MEEIKLEQRGFEMYTKAGDTQCRNLVKKVFRRIESKKRLTKEECLTMISEGMKKISIKHPEVHDTEPGYHIAHLINLKCKEVGYCFELSRYDF